MDLLSLHFTSLHTSPSRASAGPTIRDSVRSGRETECTCMLRHHKGPRGYLDPGSIRFGPHVSSLPSPRFRLSPTPACSPSPSSGASPRKRLLQRLPAWPARSLFLPLSPGVTPPPASPSPARCSCASLPSPVPSLPPPPPPPLGSPASPSTPPLSPPMPPSSPPWAAPALLLLWAEVPHDSSKKMSAVCSVGRPAGRFCIPTRWPKRCQKICAVVTSTSAGPCYPC